MRAAQLKRETDEDGLVAINIGDIVLFQTDSGYRIGRVSSWSGRMVTIARFVSRDGEEVGGYFHWRILQNYGKVAR